MGMLIPNVNDQQILGQLTNAFAFGATGIDKLRNHYQHEQFFDAHHHLERVVYRINALPIGANAQSRWYGLLSHLDTIHTGRGIKGHLHAALVNNNANHVEFDAQLDPTQADYGFTSTPLGHGAFRLTLLCPNDPYNGPVRPAGWVPPADPGEVQPTIIWP
jgi:hypothetical protein